MLICDAHADTLYAMQDRTRDASLPLDVTAERMQGDDLRVQCLALWTGPHGLRGDDEELLDREVAALNQLLDQGFRQITCVGDAKPDAVNVLLTMEGGDAFERGPQTVAAFAAFGVRIAGLVWNQDNSLAFSAAGGMLHGLTTAGKKVLKQLNQCGIAPDVSHLNDAGFEDVLSLSATPPIATHSCCRALCAHPRNLTDDQLRRLFDAGGFVGVNFYPPFLRENGAADLDAVVEHMDHMFQLGGAKHVGLGSDFDGIELHPVGLEHAGCVPALLERLRLRGYTQEAIADVAGENFRRYLDAIPGRPTA